MTPSDPDVDALYAVVGAAMDPEQSSAVLLKIGLCALASCLATHPAITRPFICM